MRWIECKIDDEVKRVILAKDPISIGRTPTCDFSFPQDRDVSRLHAIIELRGAHWYLVDQKSTNGSYVNGQRATVPWPLTDDAVIQIGEQRLHVKNGLALETQEVKSEKAAGNPHHYAVLKVETDATEAQISEAYGQLRQIYDPSLHPGNPMADKLLNELEESYRILRDPQLRSSYDETLKALPQR